MPTRVYVAIDLALSDGGGCQDGLLDELEDLMPEIVDMGETYYDVKVIGIGNTVKDMQESMKLRRENERLYGGA